ncbi:uncharacterized protein LOC132945642 [Metopolophium dirhodum]|uniref:uncharacterized protein LOC132945642 n=1 Tax=Metopolophium dirhodum TaxID=44670 RepID=UPI00299066CA|nr:uncharacterized protein LOC132945642 [Metopolophium dirhodum]
MFKFLQVNLNHCKVAQDLLRQYLSEQKVDVALVSEPYSVSSDSSSWLVSSAQELQRLEDRIRAVEPSIPVIVAGDFNARSAAWGDWCQDSRGDDLSSLLDQLGLQILNEGVKPTFIGRGRGSIVDLTAASESIVGRIHGWRVCDEAESSSDHQYITFKLQQRTVHEQTNQITHKGWKADGNSSTQHMEAGLLLAQWTGDPDIFSASANANQRASAVEAAITMACDLTFKRIALSRSRKPLPTGGMQTSRQNEEHVLRLIRGQDSTTEEEAVAAANTRYKEARKCLKTAIAGSKERCWKEMLETIDADPWGKPYKLVTRKLQGPPATTNMDANAVLRITGTLFPIRPLQMHKSCRWKWNFLPSQSRRWTRRFTEPSGNPRLQAWTVLLDGY